MRVVEVQDHDEAQAERIEEDNDVSELSSAYLSVMNFICDSFDFVLRIPGFNVSL